jgi:integrase/recombinase XerC
MRIKEKYMHNKYQITENHHLSTIELSTLISRFSKPQLNRNELMIALLLITGARSQELLSTRGYDIDHLTKSILIHGRKGSNDRRLPLNDNVYESLKSYINGGEKLFSIDTRQLRNIGYGFVQRKKTAKGNICLHRLRHTFAIETYKKSKDILLVKLAMGHKDIKSTMVYTSYVDGIESLSMLRNNICFTI